jgi:hypothetical protein
LFSQQLFFDFLENNTVRNILAPVILATWKAEIGESQFKDSCAKILVRCYLKKKKKQARHGGTCCNANYAEGVGRRILV